MGTVVESMADFSLLQILKTRTNYTLALKLAVSINFGISGLAGLTIGLFAIAAYAGYSSQTALEALLVILGLISFGVTLGIAIDR